MTLTMPITRSMRSPARDSRRPYTTGTAPAGAAQPQSSQAQGKALKDLLWWITHDGQKYSEALDYAPLPSNVVTKVERIIKSMTYGGKKI